MGLIYKYTFKIIFRGRGSAGRETDLMSQDAAKAQASQGHVTKYDTIRDRGSAGRETGIISQDAAKALKVSQGHVTKCDNVRDRGSDGREKDC
jgi:hypothetical protein